MMRPRPNRATFALAAIAIVLLSMGCAAFDPSEPPDVALADLRFTDLTVFETSGTAVVRLSNANPEPMVVTGGTYDLYVDGVRIGRALSDRRIELPRLGTATDDVELFVNNLALATRIKSIFDTGAFDYRIKAKVYVAGDYGTRTHRVVKDGYFSFHEADETSEP